MKKLGRVTFAPGSFAGARFVQPAAPFNSPACSYPKPNWPSSYRLTNTRPIWCLVRGTGEHFQGQKRLELRLADQLACRSPSGLKRFLFNSWLFLRTREKASGSESLGPGNLRLSLKYQGSEAISSGGLENASQLFSYRARQDHLFQHHFSFAKWSGFLSPLLDRQFPPCALCANFGHERSDVYYHKLSDRLPTRAAQPITHPRASIN